MMAHMQARRLAQNADVLVENFRPGVMEKWGLGPKACAVPHDARFLQCAHSEL